MNKNDYPKTLDAMSADELTQFHASVEINFNISALIAKLKMISKAYLDLPDSSEFRKLISQINTDVDNFCHTIFFDNEDEA